MEWMSDGRRRRADFGVVLPAAEAARRLRTALDPEGEWITHVLRHADRRLGDLRAGEHPEAGGLVVAIDKEHAEALAAKLTRVTGERPEIVTSDAPDASARISRFAAGSGRWLVSVLMVSEGVDVPRLRVGVYATTARTELFFRQVIGRFIRRSPLPARDAQMSHVFLPSDLRLKALAATIEEERNHALVQKEAGEAPAVERGEAEEGAGFRALWSGAARADDELLQTTQPGEALQLFGEPAPAAPAAPAVFVPATAPSAASAAVAVAEAPLSPSQRRERLRDERRELVSSLSRLTGEPHRAIHARINKATGVATVAKATAEQLEKGNRLLERDVARRR
jgi:superfamily II DNA or RNA helicase